MSEERVLKVLGEIRHNISPLIGWLRMDVVRRQVDEDGTRLDQWDERSLKAASDIVALLDEEVEYEYAIQTKTFDRLTLLDDDFPFGIKTTSQLVYWGEKDGVEKRLEWVQGEFGKDEFWLVRRRKAGEIEVV